MATAVRALSIKFSPEMPWPIVESPTDIDVMRCMRQSLDDMRRVQPPPLDHLYSGGRPVTLQEAEAMIAVACWLAT